MSDSTDNSVPVQRRFQFSVGDLLILTAAVAIGLTVARTIDRAWAWNEALLATVSTLFVFGLSAQVRDLCRAFHGRDDLTSDERWGWRLACAWRVAVAMILIGYYVVEMVMARLGAPSDEFGNFFLYSYADIREVIRDVALLITLLSIGWLKKCPVRRTWMSSMVDLLTIVGVLLFGAYIALDASLVAGLVHIACAGIEAAEPLRFNRGVIGIAANEYVRWLSYAWSVAVIVSAVNIVLVERLAQRRLRSRWARRAAIAILLAGVASTWTYIVWFYNVGLRDMAPAFYDVVGRKPFFIWLAAFVLLAIFVSAAVYRWTSMAIGDERRAELAWRSRPGRYYHERSLVLAMLLSLLVLDPLAEYMKWIDIFGADIFGPNAGPMSAIYSWEDFFGSWILVPNQLIVTLIVAQTLICLWHAWRHGTEVTGPQITPVSIRRFCLAWPAMFLALATFVVSLTWFGFAVNINSW